MTKLEPGITEDTSPRRVGVSHARGANAPAAACLVAVVALLTGGCVPSPADDSGKDAAKDPSKDGSATKVVSKKSTTAAREKQAWLPRLITIVGTGQPGYGGDGGPAREAQLNQPFGVLRTPDGALLICDTSNHVVRQVDSHGVIRTIAGKGSAGYAGDGAAATEALLNEPYEVRRSNSGDLFVVERLNHVVRRIDGKTGMISTVCGTGEPGFGGDGGPGTEAQLRQPHSIQLGPGGGLYIADIGNHRLRWLDLESGTIATFAGSGERGALKDGAAFATAPLNGPRAIDFDAAGDLWLALREGNAVYRFDMKTKTLHHAAGTGVKGFTGNGGPAKAATLSGPKGISVGPNGDVYLADTESHTVRRIDRKRGTLELVAGTGERGDGPDGLPLKASLDRLHGVFVDKDGALYIGDTENHRVRYLRSRR